MTPLAPGEHNAHAWAPDPATVPALPPPCHQGPAERGLRLQQPSRRVAAMLLGLDCQALLVCFPKWDRLALTNASSTTLMPNGSLHLAALPSCWSLPSRAHESHCVAQNCLVLVGPDATRKLRATAQPRTPAGILRITSVSQADPGTYCCVAHSVASTHHSQDARLMLKVGSPQLLQEPEILSGAQNPRVQCWNALPQATHGHWSPGATWVCSSPALSRLPESPALCTFPALTSCLPAGGCSISLEGIHVLGPGNLVISEVLVQHSSTYVCAVNRPETQIRRWHRASCLCRVSPKGQLGRVLGHPTRHGNLDEKRSSRRVRGQASWHLPPAITCLAPSEFVQWPQSLSKPPGSSTIFICVAQGVPESWLVLLKNGKGLSPGDNIRLTYNSQLVQSSKRLWVKVPFEHVFSNLEPTTVYSIHVRAYSAEGASQDSASIHTSTTGSKPATLFEVKLQAFSGNGDGKRSSHVVSRHNVPLATPGGWDPVAG
ncbi:hypothetical protein R6Z07M_000898 [Ovis aries]